MTFRKRLVVASLPQYSPASSLGIDIDEERDDSLVSSSIHILMITVAMIIVYPAIDRILLYGQKRLLYNLLFY